MTTPCTSTRDPGALLLAGVELERRLEELQQIERFAPPAAFAAGGQAPGAAADTDPDAFWAEQALAVDRAAEGE